MSEKRPKNGQKGFECALFAQTPNGPGSLLERRVFDPFLTHFLSQNGSFSRHFGIFHGPKHVTTGSKRAKNTCLSIPSGLGTTFFFAAIYYYTPLPLNLANKQASKQQATSKQQAFLLSVSAIAPPHRSGLYSTLAILEPRWCPCQIQVLSQKLTSRAPGRGRQVGRCPPTTEHFVPPKQPFLAQSGPETQSKRPNEGKQFLHLTCASTAI